MLVVKCCTSCIYDVVVETIVHIDQLYIAMNPAAQGSGNGGRFCKKVYIEKINIIYASAINAIDNWSV